MQPQRTPTGYRIEPTRLVECLHYLYYWLPKEQRWHLYGDGRKYGEKVWQERHCDDGYQQCEQ